ncbi:RtcB family protein [Akkermansiaceae bacterium]|nr:RtcB family protein [Akkermansiaceae bacterium]
MNSKIHITGPSTAFIPTHDSRGKPITVIGNEAIRKTFCDTTLSQIQNCKSAPGVTEVVLNPDAHLGYGAPIGCVMASPTHIYPGPVGVDIKCSMSLLQLDVDDDEIADPRIRRDLIKAICDRTPTGAGKGTRSVKKGREIDAELGKKAVTQGASKEVCEALGIPAHWAERCEDSAHFGHDGCVSTLEDRLSKMLREGYADRFLSKAQQLGSYGGGDHFGEAEKVTVKKNPAAQRAAEAFGLKNGKIAFLSHCGSRGLGNDLAQRQFKSLEAHFEKWEIPYPAGDKKLVYAPLGTPQGNAYLDDMALGANFATVNHLLINQLVLEAFQEVLPGCKGEFVYFISHNIAREEIVDGIPQWVHRKGATRAFPGGHHALKETPFYKTGHPVLLPGNPRDGSVVMAALPGAEKSCYSVNHGAGRSLGRKAAARTLDQSSIDREFDHHDILFNGRKYPIDEAPDAYKDFGQVLASVEEAELAHQVAHLAARFVIKDSSAPDD